jgi:heme/copper-type cytochrome/quinol oxidase subunit 3
VFNVLSEINWFAVAVSTAIFAVLGGLYFTAIVAKPYKVALGNETRELPKPGPIAIIGPLISSLLVVITTAILLRALSVEEFGDGIVFGLIVGIGYLVAQTLNIAINPNFPRPLLYTLINAPYFIVCTVAAAAILTLWR